MKLEKDKMIYKLKRKHDIDILHSCLVELKGFSVPLEIVREDQFAAMTNHPEYSRPGIPKVVTHTVNGSLMFLPVPDNRYNCRVTGSVYVQF